MNHVDSFINESFPPNTWIGGVGASYITNKSDLLAIMTGVTSSDVQNFVNDGTNISFYCGIPHGYSSTFTTANGITWLIDSLCTSHVSNTFSNSNLVKYIYEPNMLTTGSGVQFLGNNCNVLEKINFTGITNIENRYFISTNSKIKKADLRSLTQISNSGSQGSIQGMTALERLWIGNLTTFSTSEENRFLIYNTGRFPTFYNIKSGCKVYYNSALGIANRKAWNRLYLGMINVGDKFTINGLLYTCVSTIASPGDFLANATSLKNVINADSRTGTYSKVTALNDVDYIGFEVTATGAAGNAVTIVVDPANTGSSILFATNFTGGNDLHKSLMYLRDQRSCTMVQVTSPITVNPPTGLSYSGLTSTSVTLNFTAPTPNANGNDGYEVWIDDGTVFRKWFEHTEIPSSGTAIDITGVARPCKVKVRTIDGQMNYSAFTSDIILT